MKKTFLAMSLLGLGTITSAQAADYVIDTEKAHAFIHFRIQHVGFSWLEGRFNDFSGTFSYDAENPEASSVDVAIDVGSVDTNFSERDKHLREQFLETSEYPEATFKSTSFKQQADGSLIMTGDLTLHGVTKELAIPVEKVGEGEDPWGGYRAGFTGEVELKTADFNIDTSKLGPSAASVYLTLDIEGVQQ